MSSAAKRQMASRRRDNFRYGVRYVRKSMTNGKTEYVPTPMPKEALLHPQDEDYPVVSHAHDDDCNYLKNVIGVRLPRGWLVLANCRVDWGVPGIEPHGPDISVLKGLRGRKQDWKTFHVAREKVKPVAAIEISSPSTRRFDLKNKVDEYYRAGVPYFAIVDAREREGVRQFQLIGYRSGPNGYERMDLDAQGRLLLPPLGLLLGAENERVCCYDAKSGDRIPGYADVVRETAAAEEEIRRLQEELRRLRGKE